MIPGNHAPPQNQALLQLALAYHDTGYLTPPARAFLDTDHPRWSAQYFAEHVGPQVTRHFGPDASM